VILTPVPVLPLKILTVLVVPLYIIYIYFLLASSVHNHRKDIIFLMDLMEAEHMYKNFDTDLHEGFWKHKELLKEKDQRLQDTQDNETMYPFILHHLLKNVEPDLLKCMFFIILNFTALINYIIIVHKTNLFLECLIQFLEFLERMKGEKDLLDNSKKYIPLLSFDL
jgi:hypothetical protein